MVEEKIKELLIAEFEAIPPIEELEKMHTFSERHNKMMEALFAEVRRRERFERYFAAIQKIAVIALVALGLAVVSLKVVPTVYAYVEAWITENADDRLIFKDKDTEEDSGEKEELRFELGYVPEGYELESEEHSKTDTHTICYNYYDGASLQLKYFGNSSESQVSVNTEGVLVEEIVIESMQYFVFELGDGRTIVAWEDGEYLFKLEGILSKPEMLDIASSVKRVKDK